MRSPARLLLVVALAVAACGDDDDTTVGDPGTTTTTTSTSTPEDAGGSELADVAVWVGEEQLGIEQSCAGADGAVVVDTVDGRRVLLVREGGTLALRISDGAGGFEESAVVAVARTGEVQQYEAQIVVEDRDLRVRMEVKDDLDLPVCEELQG